MGGVLHTLNLRLHPEELAYIVNHADDRAVLVDESLLPLWEHVRPRVNVPTTIVVASTRPVAEGYLEYEAFIAKAEPARDLQDPDERAAAAMCYTTGTTGNPKGVMYSHRSLVLHTLGLSLDHCMGIREHDVVLPVVPMFHANAWGMPFSCVMVVAKLVMPGPCLDPASLVDLFQAERVTLTGGVPTIWMGVLQYLDANPGKFDLSSIRAMYVGGSAVPQAMIEAFEKRHGLKIIQAWGMTEMAPLGTVAHLKDGGGRGDSGSSPTAPSMDARRRFRDPRGTGLSVRCTGSVGDPRCAGRDRDAYRQRRLRDRSRLRLFQNRGHRDDRSRRHDSCADRTKT